METYMQESVRGHFTKVVKEYLAPFLRDTRVHVLESLIVSKTLLRPAAEQTLEVARLQGVLVPNLTSEFKRFPGALEYLDEVKNEILVPLLVQEARAQEVSKESKLVEKSYAMTLPEKRVSKLREI